MEKKAYISPAMVSVALNVKESLLGLSGGEDLKNGGDTGSKGITTSDTKTSGSWSVWDDNDDQAGCGLTEPRIREFTDSRQLAVIGPSGVKRRKRRANSNSYGSHHVDCSCCDLEEPLNDAQMCGSFFIMSHSDDIEYVLHSGFGSSFDEDKKPKNTSREGWLQRASVLCRHPSLKASFLMADRHTTNPTGQPSRWQKQKKGAVIMFSTGLEMVFQ